MTQSLKNRLTDILNHPAVRAGLSLLLVLCTLTCCHILLEYSSTAGYWQIIYHLRNMPAKYHLLNLMTLAIVWCALFILSNRVWLSSLLMSILCGGIAIANHYVLMFHGMPLSFLVLRNFSTAMNVISAYSFTLDGYVLRMAAGTAGLILMSILFRLLIRPVKLSVVKVLIRDAVLVILCFCAFFFGYLSANPIKPAQTITWVWTTPYHKYGYTACTMETLFRSISIIQKPDGYSQEAVSSIPITPADTKPAAEKPDIILILNEGFYDLRQATDLETDVPFLPKIDTMEDLLRGYAVVPSSGGGTNSTEYELLTSNSLQLMPGVTPFNALSLDNANSIVSHLNKLGYYTLGSHSEPAINYSRIVGYNALGFRQTRFEPDFQNTEFYGDRHFETDESLYRNLIRWYEEAPEDSPRFLYMLTIQNHSGYQMNPPELDTVHVKTDLGKYTDIANEYLTSIRQSDEAFAGLVDYFRSVDRPVIVCMLGDHAPNFVGNVVNEGYDSDTSALQQRKVPLLIWANYALAQQNLGTMSVNYIVPTLLDLASLTSSPYYSYLLQAKQQVPVITSYGKYYSTDGILSDYETDQGQPLEKIVDDYFRLEYHNLQANRNQALFDPYE